MHTDGLCWHDSRFHYGGFLRKYPDFPVALGVIRDVEAKTYETELHRQLGQVAEKSRIKCMDELLHSGATWTVK